MDRKRLLIQGSSWTVSAYKKSSTHNIDERVAGGLAELLSAEYDVTNISVQDDFNLGCWARLQQHLKNNSNYDLILICQNDPLRDLSILRSTDAEWRDQFDLSVSQLLLGNVNSITKLIDFLLDKFYKNLSQLGIPVYIFAGPSIVNTKLAKLYRLNTIEPEWTKALVPEGATSMLETSAELDYAHQLLINIFPEYQQEIKQEFVYYADSIAKMLRVWINNPDLFAYHHPTAHGNTAFFNIIKESL